MPRISLAGGLPRTPVGGSAVDRIRDQPADLEHHRSPRVLNFKAIVEAQDRLLVPEQTAPQKLNTERDTAAESALNAALAQAAQTYRASQEVEVSQALREEIRNGFIDMMKLLNDVLRPAESKPQPLQEGASRQVSMVPTPSCPEGGANGPAGIQQRQDIGGCDRRPPELPPRQRPRLPVDDSPGIDSSLSQEPEYHRTGRSDRHARPWRIEDRRTADFRDEPRLYANAGAGNGNRYIRVDRWNLSFGGEDDGHSVDDFVFGLGPTLPIWRTRRGKQEA